MVLFSFLAALCTGALAIGVPATPPIVVLDAVVTLPLARRFNATGTRNVLAHDQERAKALKMRSSQEQKPGGVNLPVEDFITTYTADVLIGTPSGKSPDAN